MSTADSSSGKSSIEKVRRSLKRRYRFEAIFKWTGLFAVMIGLVSLVVLLADNIYKGHKAFFQNHIRLSVTFSAEELGITDINDIEQIRMADYRVMYRGSLATLFPEATERQDKKLLNGMISSVADIQLRDQLLADPSLLGKTVDVWFVADDTIDTYLKHFYGRAEEFGRIHEKQVAWLDVLKANGQIEQRFNRIFFTAGDSREPEQAGIRGAVMGSFFTLLVTLALSFPLGVAAAIYLEEFAPKNKWTDMIEVNVNNLAAVPSIIFGLLGLAIFINLFGVPRSVPLVGGLVLTLMTLPTIIISGRAAIKSVPPSIREAAFGVGASKMQTVMHHVLPLSLPGMLTGTIIGMARALGETAPLLMIGMVAFIVDVPTGITDPASALPVQIFLWADSPERAFTEKTSAAILVLLLFLVAMNSLAIYLRNRLEKRW